MEVVNLNRSLIFDALADPNFYTSNPVFFFMEEQGQQAAKKHQQIAAKQACASCDQALIQRTLSVFARITVRTVEALPDEAQRLADYFRGRMGFPVEHFTIYYKGSKDELRTLDFGHTTHGSEHGRSLPQVDPAPAGAGNVAE